MATIQINGHTMYYEVHGKGDPLVLSGGWGTFCHGGERHLPAGLTDRYKVVLFDHRGIGESGDDLWVAGTTALYADDVIGLAQHLGIEQMHLVGLIGMGACIMREVAIRKPALARSMVNTGAWLSVDRFLADQLSMLMWTHRDFGFLPFQKIVTLLSFEPEYYAKNVDRLLGEQGVWSELNGRVTTHARFTEACIAHDARDRAAAIKAPTLVQPTALRLRGGGFANSCGRFAAILMPFVIVRLFDGFGMPGVVGIVVVVQTLLLVSVALLPVDMRQSSLERAEDETTSGRAFRMGEPRDMLQPQSPQP